MSSDINFLNIPVSPLSVNVQTSNLLIPTQQSSNAIASYAIRTDQTITINGGGDLDGNPLLPYDDALIYAAKGFTFNNVPILPVNRTTSGDPIFDPLTGKQVLVDNAVTVASGYTTINANNNPYIGLLPPKVVSPETITIPSYNDTKTQELNARTPLGAATITFKASSNPINNTNDWNNKFPSSGTSTNPKVVRVTGGGLNIPNGVNLSNYIITVDSGDINFNGNSNILDNVVLVTSNGNINLGKVQSNNLSVFASGAINMNGQARFGGKTLIANNSSNITFDGATKTATNADAIKVISQGNITFNGASDTRGDFLSKGTFIANGTAFIFGSINAKQNIIFNGGAYVTAVGSNFTPTNLILSNNSISENVFANTLIGNFSSTDPDFGNTFTYSLVTGSGSIDNDSFTVFNNELYVVNPPNFESKNSYSIRVRTTDQGGLSYEKVFTVNITDVNEAPIALVLSNNTTPENVVANSLIGKFTSTDPDSANTFTYSLVTGTGSTDNAAFTVINNELRVVNSPNFEAKNSYSIRVRTTDQGGLSFEKVFTVSITDVNEAPTALVLSNNTTPENVVANSLIGKFTSTDPDTTPQTFTYRLVSGTGSTDNASFSIVNNELRIVKSPDFEAKNTYSIRVRTTDQGGLSFEKVFTVSITDVNEAPIALVLSNNTTPENVAANSLIGNFASTDPDSANTFTYRLVTGTGSTDNDAFTVINNELRVVNSPNFEAKNSYSVRVRTTDQGGLSFEKVFTVSITDVNEAPTALVLSNNTTPENVAANSLIGKFTSTDPDTPPQTFTYSLVSETGSTDNASFKIANNELRIVNSPDFDAKNTYNIKVRTTDKGGLSYEKVFTVNITDVNEAPIALVLSNNTTPENVAANSLIGDFTSSDPDSGNTFTYRLVNGTGSTDNASFKIANNELRIVNSPDFEAKNSYSIRVRTTDQSGLSFEKVFTVNITNVNEAPTTLVLSNNAIPENVVADSLIGKFTSTDPDTTPQTFTYNLVAGTGSTDNASFSIVNNELLISTSPDFETKSTYSIRVRTTDQGGLSFEKVFSVRIIDLYEPIITLDLSNNSTPENVPENTLVGRFSSTLTCDPSDDETHDDEKIYGHSKSNEDSSECDEHENDSCISFTYSLVSGTGSTDNASFSIINNELHIINSPDFETKNIYNIRVRTTNQGGLSFEKTFTVNITDVNEAPIALVLSNNTTPENVGANSLIGNFTSTDPDSGNTFTYSLVTGTGSIDNASFSVTNNELRIVNSPDFEAKNSYSIRVRTTDQGGLSFEKIFAVGITDVNETPTALVLSNNTTPENVVANSLIGTFASIDPDSGNTFTYGLVTGTGSTDNAAFEIANNELRIVNSPDFETKNSYSIRVKTTDQGDLSYEKIFTVNITDVNEAPITLILSNNITPENVAANSLIGNFASTDPDSGNTFTYNLVTGIGSTDNAAFAIANNELRIVNSPDFETKNSYSIRVRTTDQGGLFYEKIFTVGITDINDVKPLGFMLDSFFDSAPIGDSQTTFATVKLVGLAFANATVTLQSTGTSVTADATGKFAFDNIALSLGDNSFTVNAIDATGNNGTSTIIVKRVAQDNSDVILDWNATLLNAIAIDKSAPPIASRNMAIVQTAIFDAINSFTNTYKNYHFAGLAPTGESIEAAAASAAYRTLVNLYPTQTVYFDSALTTSLAQIADGAAEDAGVAFGRAVADDILAFRSTDGSSNPATYIPGTTLGDWQPTAPSFATALLPNWGLVTPFGLTSGSQFRPAGDPALTSDQYTADFNQVKDLGSLNSTTRTADQTEIAKFWADGAGTYTPPGHWNQIAQNIVANQGNSLLDNARLFALLDIGLADAGIAAWDAKYTYNTWRPITAIQQADTDGNSNTLADPNWKPLITTPPFPEYVSGHSTFSGTAETILSALLGNDISFTTNSLGTPGIYRTFGNFTSAANEAGISRIYGGIHFYFSNVDGLATGRSVGNYILQNALAPVITLTTLSNDSTIENVPADSLIGAFNTTSESNRFTYSLVDGFGSTDNVAFTLINNQLHIVSSPDFETKSTYSIRVRTTDRDGSYAEKIFTISILDVNENLNPLAIAAQLQQDTGSNSTDKITSNPAITGTITAAGTIVELKAGFGTTASFDILSNYSNGNFTLDANRLNQIAGQIAAGTLTDGLKTLKISVMDNLGNLNFIDFGFTLDRNAPLFPSFGLAPAFDTSPVGDSQTTAANVTLTGQTEANTTVTLFVVGQTTGTSATADASGKFVFANVALNLGANAFTVEAKDIAGNISTFATNVTRVEIPPEVIQLSVKPGEQLKIDSKVVFGKTANFSLFSDRDLPVSMLQGDGTLTFKPTPDQVGTYQFNLIARDGSTVTTQEFNLNVVADPNTTTRISGVIKSTDGVGLEGVIVTIGNFSVTTGSDGSFILTLPEVPPDGTALIIQPGQEFNGVVYPSIAEPLPLLLGHDVYGNVANIIDRPIYLPAIDVANAQTINPTIDQTVTSAAIPGSSVFVAANSLFDREGYPYTEQLSITKVPTALTPAALPSNLFPDLVVTIQPGEMRFSTPAPLSLPNLAGYPVGTLMDLWSINPVTGSFDNVGTGQVSADGLVVNTISGGIRNSSWHFFAPPPPTPKDPDADPRNPDDGCDECKATAPATSEVQLHSGAVIETHDLISYQSQGASRGLTLRFDSERADARPILHFGYNNARSDSNVRLIAELSIRRGDFSLEVPGFAGEEYFGLFQGYNFWSIPNGGGSIDAALQADLRDLASGRYDYDLNSGLMQFTTDPSNGFPVLNGSTSRSQGKFLHVNTSNSNFGSGWGLAGLEELVINPDGSVLIINGDGGEVLFEKKADNSYDSPPGDYSVLEQLSDGTFRRTMKDETVYSFNSDNLLTKVSDRYANETKYLYQNRNLIKIVDPVGLETTFTYSGDRISAIIDPAGRSTNLTYDSNGNLTKITDPDGTSRTWEYDANHHMIAEVDKRGDREQTFYDFAGRAKSAIRKDGSILTFDPVQVQGLYEANRTISPVNAPAAFRLGQAASTYTDANGNQTVTVLDKAGQTVSATDAVGALPSVQRNQDNLVARQTDGRGNITSYTYDEVGNIITSQDSLSFGSAFIDISTTGQALSGIANSDDVSILTTIPFTFDFYNASYNQIGVSSNGLISFGGTNSSYTNTNLTSGVLSTPSILPFWDDLDTRSNEGISPQVYTQTIGANGNRKFIVQWHQVEAYNFNSQIGNITFQAILNEGTNVIQFNYLDVKFDGDTDLTRSDGQSATIGIWNSASQFQQYSFNQPSLRNGLSLVVTEQGITEATGASIGRGFKSYTYDPIFNQVTSETDEIGRKTLYDIDPLTGNVRSTTRVVGTVGGDDDLITRYTYTAVGLQDIIIDPMGRIVDYDYDAQGRTIKITFAKGTVDEATQQFEYDLAGNQTATIDELGRRTEYRYDLVNRLIETIYPDETPATLADNPRTKSEYDAVGNQIATIDELGRRTTFTYDALDRLIKTTEPDPDGIGVLLAPETRYEYDAIGNQIAMIDQLGRRTQYQYDARNRLIATIHADGSRETSSYDADSNLSASRDANNNLTTRQYDARGRLTKISQPNGNTTFEYDSANQLIAQTDANGNRTQYIYDELGRRIMTIDALGGETVTSYDKNGNVIAETDALNRTTIYGYDNRDRQISTTRVVGAIGGNDDLITSYTYTAVGLEDKIIDPMGRIVDYDYDAQGRTIKITFAKGTVDEANQQFEYDAAGNQTATIDELGRRTEYRYDIVNRLIETIYPDNTPATLADNPSTKSEYDAVGNQIAKIDELGRRTAFEYDVQNRLVKTTEADPDGVGVLVSPKIRYVYDANGNKTAEIDQLDRTTQYQYDAQNLLIAIVYPDGSRETSTYDGNGNLTRSTDANGNITTREYDAKNRLIKIVEPNGNRIFEYDSADQLIAQTDANGNRTTYAYDEVGRRIRTIDAIGGISAINYDKNGNAIAQTDQLDRTVSYDYDNRDRQTTTTSALGFTSRKLYDAVGNVVSAVDANNHATNYVYDERNRQTEAIDALNQSTKTTYDAVGNVTATTNQLNQTSTYRYDNLNHRIEAIDLLNQSTKTEYDLFGNVIAVIDPLGQRTGYGYDLKNRKNTVTDALGKVTKTSYDGFGNVLTIIDPVNNQTRYEYQDDIIVSSINRLSSEVNASGAVRKYTYDPVGNITSITDRDGTVQKYTYDKLNRRTQEQWFDVLGNLTRNIVSIYNAAGELTQIADPDSTYSYTYDLDGRMLAISNEGTPNLPTTIMSYSYDNVGNVLSMIDTINGSLGIATTREYDALNRLTTNAQGYKQVIYAYNAISQVITKYRYSVNNLVAETNHIYDNLNRLTNITHSNGTGANTIASYSQTYDQGDRITGVTSNDGNSSYTYDDTNQLISGEYDFQDNESYSYDSNGNRTNDGYVTGVNNQLLEDNKYLYEYDLVGNRTKRTDKSTNEVMEYRWDIRDRLTGIIVKNDLGEIIRTAEYTYDVYNQRIAKTVDTDGDGSLAAVTERFVYGPDQNIALVFDENGNVNHRYLFGDGIDQIEADESNGNVLWALTDHLGSVRDIVDDSGTVLNHIVYDAFGGVTSQTDESVVFRYGYTARELDAESGLQYNRARYLDSFTGKFISEDPISFQGGDSNLYRYVNNNSINFFDPSGNIKIELVQNPLGRFKGKVSLPAVSIMGFRQRIPEISYDLSVTHAFILVTDDRKRDRCEPGENNTNQTYYRGGPLVTDFGAQISKGDSGPIVTKYGKYTKNTIDYKSATDQIRSLVYSNPGESIDKYNAIFTRTLGRIQSGNFKYFIPGPNSNTVAHQLLKDAGLPDNLPYGVRPPGWEYDFWNNNLPKYNPNTNIPYRNLFPGFDYNLNPIKEFDPSDLNPFKDFSIPDFGRVFSF